MSNEVINWLLKSDPSVIFQTKRDILDLPKKDWIEDQKIIPKTGWGKQILDSQSPKGYWERGCSAKVTVTHYTLLLLRHDREQICNWCK